MRTNPFAQGECHVEARDGMLGAGGRHCCLGDGILRVDQGLEALFLFSHVHCQRFGRVHALIECLHIFVDFALRNRGETIHDVFV